jgi:hypothetical protein
MNWSVVIGLLRWPLVVPFLAADDPAAVATFETLNTVLGQVILAGLLVPLGVPGADLANFIGYVLWSVFLMVLALSRPRVLKVA